MAKIKKAEALWFAAKTIRDLQPLHSTRKQPRKWRLLATACCRRALERIEEPRLGPLLASTDQFADETITWEDLKKARRLLPQVRKIIYANECAFDGAPIFAVNACDCASCLSPLTLFSAIEDCLYVFDRMARSNAEDWEAAINHEIEVQVRLARDIFCNPFRPVAFEAAWRTSTTTALAGRMYESRHFAAMPILADALEEAGCVNPDILRHCREPGVHVRGCWVVDHVLGKV